MNPIGLAVLAYAWWGLVPAYWKQLPHIPAEELILHRIILSLVCLFPALIYRRDLGSLLEILRKPKQTLGCLITALLIGFNWYLYIWAIANNHVVESSLGYFLNPLINVALGTLLLKERMNKPQRLACGLAASGTALLTWQTGALPWIALLLALSFGLYGFGRKILQLPTLAATFAETFVLTIPALLLLTGLFQTGTLKASDSPARELLWLSLSGLVTTVPLLAFTEAAKRLPLIYLGMLQFISPTAQFLLGVFVYQEPFQSDRWISFGLIWSALAVFLIDLWRRAKSEKRSGKPSLYAQRQRASELAPK